MDLGLVVIAICSKAVNPKCPETQQSSPKLFSHLVMGQPLAVQPLGWPTKVRGS